VIPEGVTWPDARNGPEAIIWASRVPADVAEQYRAHLAQIAAIIDSNLRAPTGCAPVS